MTSAPDTPATPPPTGDGPAHVSQTAMSKLLARPLTDADVRAHTASVAQPMTERSTNVRGVMVIRLGDERLALPAESVARVTRERPAHRIPHRTNAVVRGVCNIDGDLVLTVAIEELLQIPADREPSASRRMVMIGEPNARWAFAVDDVLGVESIETQSMRDLPVTVERALVHFARALLTVESGQATLLAPDAIVRGCEGALR